tara:strand:- start:10431 stop:10871 length:441 start_codon:yes stop_codon:yes gene_type:complete
MSDLEDFVEFKVKKYSKFQSNIVYITYLKETLTTDPELFDEFIKKYRESLIGCGEKNTFLVVNSKEIKSIDFTYVWSKMDVISKLDDLARQYLAGTAYIINNVFFKTMGNSIMKVYKPVVPTKICNDNKEAIEFMNNVLSQLNKKE